MRECFNVVAKKERMFARRRTKVPNLAEILAAASLSRDCSVPRRSFNGGHYCTGASINCIRASPVALYMHYMYIYIYIYIYAQVTEKREKKGERFLCRSASKSLGQNIIIYSCCLINIARREICGSKYPALIISSYFMFWIMIYL